MRGVKSPLRLTDIVVSTGEINDAFQCSLNDRIAFVGQLNKQDNSVRSITMIAQGDGTLASGADIALAMAAVINTTNPDLTASERGLILRELKLFDSDVDVPTRHYLLDNELKSFSGHCVLHSNRCRKGLSRNT